ncbi:hypothetical protein M0R45_036722 [Rubus argutus]|uniref:Uncharacterized protein n=1 Tax=Rubus argutus TaxID=59490 RepID=A0AAW1VZL9_RUBAR
MAAVNCNNGVLSGGRDGSGQECITSHALLIHSLSSVLCSAKTLTSNGYVSVSLFALIPKRRLWSSSVELMK